MLRVITLVRTFVEGAEVVPVEFEHMPEHGFVLDRHGRDLDVHLA